MWTIDADRTQDGVMEFLADDSQVWSDQLSLIHTHQALTHHNFTRDPFQPPR